MIYVLAALTAFASFIHEINLSQALSGALGGTILRYHTGFGLFTCFLGLGAWFYDVLRTKASSRRILATSQILLIIAGALGPFWIQMVNPLQHDVHWDLLLTALCYLPLIGVALVSGVELPALVDLAGATRADQNLEVLGWDYVGMFIASLCYPLLFLYQYGVFGSAGIAAAINGAVFIAIVALFRESKSVTAAPRFVQDTPVERRIFADLPAGWIALLIFLLSFCSMSYELVTAKSVSDFISDEVLGHSVTIGLFLLGLGFGTFQSSRVKAPRRALIVVEIALTFLGTMTFLILTALSTFWMTTFWISDSLRGSHWAFVLLAPIAFLIGYLSGFELPLLLRCWPEAKSIGRPLSLSYAGALLAGFVVPLILLPHCGVAGSLIVTALLNLFGLGFLLFRTSKRTVAIGAAAFLALALLIRVSLTWDRIGEQVFLKSYYMQLRLDNYHFATFKNFFKALSSSGPILRVTSAYQFIDLVTENSTAPMFKQNNFTLYLNRKPQFSSDSWKTYHQSLIYGAFNLAQANPSSVLILGGGDGILASQLLKKTQVKHITLVELDPTMIKLAKTQPEMLDINGDIFDDPRVHLVIDDAFKYLHRTNKTYDAVFIDFPYPNSFELSRVFSVEFYTALRQRLAPHAFIAMDAPIWYNLDENTPTYKPHEILFNTLQAAGFRSIKAFGPIEPFLVATPDQRVLKFHYRQFPPDMADRTFVNMTSLDFLVEPWKRDASKENSVYHPQRFDN